MVLTQNPPAFGFIHPFKVIHRVHITPSFNDGITGNLLEPYLARLPHEGNLNFEFYYVNSQVMFVAQHILLTHLSFKASLIRTCFIRKKGFLPRASQGIPTFPKCLGFSGDLWGALSCSVSLWN
jgi:hypothetical protein